MPIMRATVCWAVAASFALTSPTLADAFFSGNQLLKACQTKGAQESGCVGYLAGIVDAGEVSAADQVVGPSAREGVGFGLLHGWRWCVSKGVDTEQVEDVVVKFLKDNPKERHLSAAPQVAQALSKGWPCPK